MTSQCSTTFPFFKLENINNGEAERARLAYGMIVSDDVVAVGVDVLDLGTVVRKFVLQEGDIGLQPLRAVCGERIVLGVTRSKIFRRRIEVLLIERRILERGDRLLVRLELLGARRTGVRHSNQYGNRR